MSLETDLRTYLLADAGISALVGTRAGPEPLAQNSPLPAITYRRIDTQRGMTLGGPEALQRPYMVLTSWAVMLIDARDLADKIRHRLTGFAGIMGSTTIQVIFPRDDRDGYEPEVPAHFTDLDFEIWAEEALS
jgi:hypothetical protein